MNDPTDTPKSNVINLRSHKPHITLDLDLDYTEEMTAEITHEYVMSSLDKIQEDIRNTPSIKGIFVLAFDEHDKTVNWIMGDIKITLLYTALSSIKNEILKIFNGTDETNYEEME